MEELPQIAITRKDKLCIWIKRQGLTQAHIARALNVGGVSVSRWLKADTIPCKRHEQLVKLGIPAELLPEPLDITPGPKRPKKEKSLPMLSHSPLLPALPH